ncbi:hypothetical protein NEIFL0001_0242 [Neisseria flavescens SK114]|nr:hypothetical protein NEIFL0001_0242 [Neisseria flavescens SK114]
MNRVNFSIKLNKRRLNVQTASSSKNKSTERHHDESNDY